MISWLLVNYLLETLQWALSKTWEMFVYDIILYYSRNYMLLFWKTHYVIL
jgi:hypothetical protein